MDGIVQHDALKPLYVCSHWLMSRTSTLDFQDPSCKVVDTFLCAEGIRQGCVAGPLFFGAATLGAFKEVQRACLEVNFISVLDDCPSVCR